MTSICSTTTKKVYTKTYRGAPGIPRRAKRARGGALGHPGRDHVEMRGVPGPSGCGARDPFSALLPGSNLASKSHIHVLTPVVGGSSGIGCSGGCDARGFKSTSACMNCAKCGLDFCSTCCMSECPMKASPCSCRAAASASGLAQNCGLLVRGRVSRAHPIPDPTSTRRGTRCSVRRLRDTKR
jgi:hypothetical protein